MAYEWYPHPGPQTDFCSRWEFEVMFGGSAGPGKTDCLIIEATRYVAHPSYKALILRRTFPQLQEIIDRTRQYYPLIDKRAEYKSSEHRWYWPSGATTNLSHIQHPGDEYNFQGKEFQFIGFDEVCQFTPKMYLYLFSRVRSTIPGLFPRIRAATNPGGIGHQFFKDRFRIGLLEPRTTIVDSKSGLTRVFIPAKLQDNPTLLKNDPEYVKRLLMLPEIERKRLMDGDWDTFEGQVFSELNQQVHGIEPFDIPPEWERYRSFDWGYAKPFSVGWWAIDFDGKPYRYRAWYGNKPGDEVDKGLRMSATEIARGIHEREQGEKVKPGPADPAIWSKRPKKDGSRGISVAEEMAGEKITWIPADNDRLNGLHQFHSRLRLDDEGEANVYIFNNDEHFWRTVPGIQENPKHPEDVETESEDHIYDEVRYFFMFRPMKPRHKPQSDAGSFQATRRKQIAATDYAKRYGVSMGVAYGRVR